MKLLLIDDEPLLIKSMLLIDWRTHGFSQVFTANKASVALDIVQNNEIDLLISDIKMPGLTGLDLYEQILIHFPNMLCIYISGYEKFSYAKQAVKLHAVDFLTKPVKDDELLAAVGRATELIQQREDSPEDQFAERKIINRFLNGKLSTDEIEKIAFFKEGATYSEFQLIAIKYSETDISLENLIRSVSQLIKKSSQKYLEAYFIYNKKNCLYYVIKKKNKVKKSLWHLSLDNIRLIIHQTLFLTVRVYYSAEKLSLAQLVQHLRFMRDQLYNMPLSQKSVIEVSPQITEDSFSFSIQELHKKPSFQQLFEIENFEEIYKKLTLIEVEVSKNTSDSHALQDELLFTFINSFYYLISIKNSTIIKNMRDSLIRLNLERSYSSFSELIIFLRTMTQEFQEESQKLNSFSLIDRINHLIYKNTEKNITVSWIAEALNYHPAYISKIYKEKTGHNLKDIIFQEKMQYATRLLRNPELRIYEIAELVGFANISYFSAQFKNTIGMTPLDYRNSIRSQLI